MRVLTRTRSPFAAVLPSIVLTVLYLAAAAVWATVGDALPGGRWLAVHLFTLGVLSNAVLGMSQHFTTTLTRAPGSPRVWLVPAFNVGALGVLVGVASTTRWLTGTGASITTLVVVMAYLDLRRMRTRSLGARFAWIVRLYERAHGAFVHGALLGLLMGVGVLSGGWYGSARLAHLHVNVLGWGGVTLLATLVFFGPTVARQRIEEGADDRAARALRHGTTGLSIGTILLFASGVGDPYAVPLRVGAAIGLGVLAWAGTVTCLAVARVAHRSEVTARWAVAGVAVWLPLALWADVAVVATGTWRYLDALGLVALVGVLLQAVVLTLLHLAPTFVRSGPARERVRAAFDRLGGARVLVFNVGVGALVVAAVGRSDLGATGAVFARTGAVLVIVGLLLPLVSLVGASWSATPSQRERAAGSS